MQPRRVLIVSAEMGEGHNAAARAIAHTIERIWSGCEIRQIDAIRRMGPGVSPLLQAMYRFQLRTAPWMYQLFYDALWRWRWFAASSKRLIGSWCGRRLDRPIRRYRPDLIISTYPMGSAALDWLRRRWGRGLPVPTAAFVTDFAPHPFWLFSGVDVHFLMHEVAVGEARRAVPNATVRVGAAPVDAAFSARSPAEPRARHDLRPDALVVLVTGGAWGVGTLETAVRSLLAADRGLQVVAVCGRNKKLRQRLASFQLPSSILVPLGFVDSMPDLLAASDAVVTNAGGLTSLEALRSGRPLILFDPIVGHGRANADLMQRAGLAVISSGPEELVRTVRKLAEKEPRMLSLAAAARKAMAGQDLEQDLRYAASISPPPAMAWKRGVRRVVATGTAAVVAGLLLFQATFLAGTRFASAARGAPKGSREVALAITGWASPPLLQSVIATAASAHIPLTVFVEGRVARTDPALISRLDDQGWEVEAGTWVASRDDVVRAGRDRSEFARTIQAIVAATGDSPRYVAEPGGRFSLVAVRATDSLGLRRVVFRTRLLVASQTPPLVHVSPGAIVEFLLQPGASPAAVSAALLSIWGTVRAEGLRLVTVAEIDGRTEDALTLGRGPRAWTV